MTDIKKAEAVIPALEQKRIKCVQRGTDLQDEIASVALAAHTGDAAARKKLDALNRESAEHASELQSLDAALRAASERLEKAKQAEASRADREAASELRAVFDQFVELAEQADEALANLVTASAAMSAAINQIHSLGHAAPTGQQWLVYGEQALHSALMQTVWSKAFRHLAPSERRVFGDLAHGWQAAAEHNIAARLGEQTTENAA